jgi:hypothetical protein
LKEVLVAGGAKVNESILSKVVEHCQGKDVLQVKKYFSNYFFNSYANKVYPNSELYLHLNQ